MTYIRTRAGDRGRGRPCVWRSLVSFRWFGVMQAYFGVWVGPLSLSRCSLRLMQIVLASTLVAVYTQSIAAEPKPEPRTTPDAFQRQFERAFASGELAEALALFHWRGVPTTTREGVVVLVQRDLGATLRRSGWLPAEPVREFWSEGVRMRSNLTVIARFAAEFEVEGGARHLSVHEVGIVAGVFYIGLAEPVPNAQSVMLDRPSDATLAVHKSGLISSSLPPLAAAGL